MKARLAAIAMCLALTACDDDDDKKKGRSESGTRFVATLNKAPWYSDQQKGRIFGEDGRKGNIKVEWDRVPAPATATLIVLCMLAGVLTAFRVEMHFTDYRG